MNYFVYRLDDPVTGAFRYFGVSVHPEFRAVQHGTSAGNNAPLRAWIQSLWKSGKSPSIAILSSHPTLKGAVEEESRLIAECAASGATLFNRYFRLTAAERKRLRALRKNARHLSTIELRELADLESRGDRLARTRLKTGKSD